MFTIRPSKARRNSPFKTRMNPASAINSTCAAHKASMYLRSASSSSLVRNLPGSINRAGMFHCLARSRMPASATSLNTIANSAGTLPLAQATAIARKLDPLPEPSTPIRNFRLAATDVYYRQSRWGNKQKAPELAHGHCHQRQHLDAPSVGGTKEVRRKKISRPGRARVRLHPELQGTR